MTDGGLDPHIFARNWQIELSETSESSHTHRRSGSESSEDITSGSGWPGAGYGAKGEHVVTRAEIEKMAQHIDEVREQYREDIALMKNRSKLMPQQRPRGLEEVAGQSVSSRTEVRGLRRVSVSQKKS